MTIHPAKQVRARGIFLCLIFWFRSSFFPLLFCASVVLVGLVHRCWGKSFNFIIWVGWHALLFHPLDTQCHKSTQTSHLLCDWDCDSYRRHFFPLAFAEFQTMRSNSTDVEKKLEENVSRNKNNHEIVVNLVVSHWRLSVFIQEISFFCYSLARTGTQATTLSWNVETNRTEH